MTAVPWIGDRSKKPETEGRLQRRVKAGLVTVVLLMSLLGILSWRLAREAAEDADWVAHSREVETGLEAALRHLDDVETGARGFAMTGNKPFLEPYESGKLAFVADLQALRILTVDRGQQQRLDTFAKQAKTRLEAAEDLVTARQSSEKVPSIAQLERGKRLMDVARATLDDMETQEKQQLNGRVQRAHTAREFTSSVIASASILGVILLSLAGISLGREIGMNGVAQAQIKALNADLEQRVKQRTSALESEVAAHTATEAKRRTSEEISRLLLDGIADYAVYMLDLEGRVVTWNSGAARIKGYDAAEIVGKHVSCFYTQADRDHSLPEESLKQALSQGRFEAEGWRVRKDGSAFWANALITPLYEANGDLRGYCKVVRDITSRKQAEEELQKQAALLDLAHDAILVRDLDSRIVFWNKGAQFIYGWSAEEVSGQVTHDLLQTKFPVPLAAIEVMLTSKGEWEGELRHVTRHGTEVTVASRWSLQRDQHGAPVAILEINRDITLHKRAEVALGESEGRLAGVIASAMDAILTVDEQQRIVLFNCAAEKMFRCPMAEAMGRPITRFIPQRFHAGHAEHVQRFSQTGVTNRAMGPQDVLWAVRADGQEFQIEASISQVVTGGKKLFTVILRDVTERKQMEEIRERLAAVVDSSDDAIVSKTLDGTIAAWNRGAEKIFGYPASEAIGHPMQMLIPAERINEEDDILARIRRGESVEHFETVRIRKDGRSIDISATISPIRDRAGAIIGASKIARDITGRKRAEAALQETETNFRGLVNLVPQMVWMCTNDGLNTYFNDRWEQYTGLTLEQSYAAGWNTPFHPDDKQAAWEAWSHATATGEIYRIESRLRAADGSYRWFLMLGAPLRDATGHLVKWFGTCTDIHEMKLTQAALAESEDRFWFFVEHAPAALAMFDREMRYLHVSNRWRTDYSLGDRELRGLSHYQVFPEVPTQWKEAHRRGLAGEVLRGDKDRFDRPDGSVQWIRWEIRPWSDWAGEIGGIVIFTEDITERNRAEEGLREKDHLLSESQRIAHVGSWTYDPKDSSGRIVWSEEMYRIHGVSSDTFTPTLESFLNLVVPEDRLAMQSWVAACAADEKPGDLEFQVVRPDGSRRFMHGRGELQVNAGGLPIQMAGTSQDITDRKQAEGALHESEERFQAMANGIPQLAWMADADGSIFWYNQRWYDYTGTTLDQMLGWAWQSVHDPQMLPQVLERWQDAIATGQPFDMEFPLRGADGIFRAFLTRVMPLKDTAGRVVRWFGTNTDITERKQAGERLAAQAAELSRQAKELLRSQHALESQKLMLQSVLDSMVEGLIAADERGNFIIWNPAAEKIVGRGMADLSPEEWSAHYGAYLPDKVTPFPLDQNPLLRAIHGEVSTAEMFFRRPDLERAIWIESRGAPLRDQTGELRGGVIAFRDITQEKEDERKIRKLNEDLERRIAERTAQLEAANRDLESFTYSVSHDLRAPLRHIGSFTKLLSHGFGSTMPPEAQGYLHRIESGSARMALMVESLLGLAKLGRKSLKARLVELNGVVEEVIQLLKPECEGRDVEWRIASLPALECDPILIGQVFQNLLANALKYSGRRSTAVVEIGSQQLPGKPTVIFVRDNGAGFDMQNVAKLFGVFQRLHTVEEFEGTGVGLATVHRIIQKHGGRIWAQAEPDRGATFYFTLGDNGQTSTAESEPQQQDREQSIRAMQDLHALLQENRPSQR